MTKTYIDIIQELRKAHKLKQQDIARLLGTTQQMYSRYEKGENELPIHHLIKLCNFYGVSADYILCINADISKKEGKSHDFR